MPIYDKKRLWQRESSEFVLNPDRPGPAQQVNWCEVATDTQMFQLSKPELLCEGEIDQRKRAISAEVNSEIESVLTEKNAAMSRYLEKYSSQQAPIDMARAYSSVGPFGIHKIDDYQTLYNVGRIKLFSGIPKVSSIAANDPDRYFDNPVTVAQAALLNYGLHLLTDTSQQQFVELCDYLMTLVSKDGRLPYKYPWRYYTEEFAPGWVSGMAQGQALSAFSRAYRLTGDDKYLRCSERICDAMLRPLSDAGTRGHGGDLSESLSKLETIEEYVVTPQSYTLNGWIFSIIGLFDYWQVLDDRERSEVVLRSLNKQLQSLVIMLPSF